MICEACRFEGSQLYIIDTRDDAFACSMPSEASRSTHRLHSIIRFLTSFHHSDRCADPQGLSSQRSLSVLAMVRESHSTYPTELDKMNAAESDSDEFQFGDTDATPPGESAGWTPGTDLGDDDPDYFEERSSCSHMTPSMTSRGTNGGECSSSLASFESCSNLNI